MFRGLTSFSANSWHSKQLKFGIFVLQLCSLQLKGLKFTGLLWLCCTLTHPLCSGKSWETERQNLFSTLSKSSTSACLGCIERKRARQADKEKVPPSFQKSQESLNRCVDLHERKKAATLTCWVTLRMRSVFLSSWSTDGSLNTSEHQRC